MNVQLTMLAYVRVGVWTWRGCPGKVWEGHDQASLVGRYFWLTDSEVRKTELSSTQLCFKLKKDSDQSTPNARAMNSERMNEWTNERMNEWTNERMNEWTNERMIEQAYVKRLMDEWIKKISNQFQQLVLLNLIIILLLFSLIGFDNCLLFNIIPTIMCAFSTTSHMCDFPHVCLHRDFPYVWLPICVTSTRLPTCVTSHMCAFNTTSHMWDFPHVCLHHDVPYVWLPTRVTPIMCDFNTTSHMCDFPHVWLKHVVSYILMMTTATHYHSNSKYLCEVRSSTRQRVDLFSDVRWRRD